MRHVIDFFFGQPLRGNISHNAAIATLAITIRARGYRPPLLDSAHFERDIMITNGFATCDHRRQSKALRVTFDKFGELKIDQCFNRAFNRRSKARAGVFDQPNPIKLNQPIRPLFFIIIQQQTNCFTRIGERMFMLIHQNEALNTAFDRHMQHEGITKQQPTCGISGRRTDHEQASQRAKADGQVKGTGGTFQRAIAYGAGPHHPRTDYAKQHLFARRRKDEEAANHHPPPATQQKRVNFNMPVKAVQV